MGPPFFIGAERSGLVGGEIFAPVYFASGIIPDAIEYGPLDIAAGHFHEVAFFMLFLDQRAEEGGETGGRQSRTFILIGQGEGRLFA